MRQVFFALEIEYATLQRKRTIKRTIANLDIVRFIVPHNEGHRAHVFLDIVRFIVITPFAIVPFIAISFHIAILMFNVSCGL